LLRRIIRKDGSDAICVAIVGILEVILIGIFLKEEEDKWET
jgi:hypothetical protein